MSHCLRLPISPATKANVAPSALAALHDLLRALQVAAGDHHLRPGFDKSLRASLANTGSPAGYQHTILAEIKPERCLFHWYRLTDPGARTRDGF